MKRRIVLSAIVVLLVLTFVAVKPFAQQPALDKQKSRQELETMKGILKTSISYALKRTETKPRTTGEPAVVGFGKGDWGIGGIDAFYLQGQGAVFVIPLSAFRLHGHMDLGTGFEFTDLLGVEETALFQAEIAKGLSEGMAEAAEELKAQTESGTAKAQVKPKPQPKIEIDKEKLEKMQQKIQQNRAEAKKRHEELLARVEKMKGSLKETLANYGDSLTIVKPDEFVTVVISGGSNFKMWDEAGEEDEVCHVVSVKKSLVTDLKAGKISREEFERRVTDYSY